MLLAVVPTGDVHRRTQDGLGLWSIHWPAYRRYS